MSNSRQLYGSSNDNDPSDDASPNPLYKATSHSEHSSLNRHGGKKTLAELSGSSAAAVATDRDTRREDRQQYSQKYQSHTLPLSRTSNQTNATLVRPDSQTWDRHAMGRTAIGSPGRTATPAVGGSSGGHLEETAPSKSPSFEDKKSEPSTKQMQARSIRLSLGASSDLPKEPRKLPMVNCHEKIVCVLNSLFSSMIY